ncbi:hypothetical protein V8E36_009177 [Tilletia maclaganii]
MDASQRLIYRRLLRAARAAVKFHPPAAFNIRRALRDDFLAAQGDAAQHSIDPRFEESARNTIALLLSSAISPREHRLDTSSMSSAKLRQGPSSTTSAATCAYAALLGFQVESSTEASSSMSKDDQKQTPNAASSSSSGPDNTLAHEVFKNIGSLVYHHLSPNTQMQPVSRRKGGTSAANVSGKTGRGSSVQDADAYEQALDAMSDGDAGGYDAWSERDEQRSAYDDFNPFSGEYRVPALVVPSKPLRGPMGHNSARWDGQDAKKILLTSKRAASVSLGNDASSAAGGTLATLERRVLDAVESYRAARERAGPEAAETLRLHTQMRTIRGLYRRAVSEEQTRKRKQALAEAPRRRLFDLVRDVEESEKVWLGGTRFGKWVRNEWLPP